VKERDVLKLVTDYLTSKRVWWMRLNTGAMSGAHKGKKWFVRFAKPGTADLIAVRQTDFFDRNDSLAAVYWLEVKAPKGRVSEAQEQFQQEVTEAGMNYLVVRGLDDLQKAGL
jgi:hypothetical protein